MNERIVGPVMRASAVSRLAAVFLPLTVVDGGQFDGGASMEGMTIVH